MNIEGNSWPERPPWSLVTSELSDRVMFTLAAENHRWCLADRAGFLVLLWTSDSRFPL